VKAGWLSKWTGFVAPGYKRVVDIRRSRWRWVIIALVFVIAIIAAVIGSIKPKSNVTLTNLNNVDELRARFNQDAGNARLLLLLSPT
jgi:hypothetical protein